MDGLVDASSLIVLARSSALFLLYRVVDHVHMTSLVQSETVDAGKARGYSDAGRIESELSEGRVLLLKPTARERQSAKSIEQRSPALSVSDCQTLACAQTRGLVLVMEDRRARNEAARLGIEHMTIQVLPLYALIRGTISLQEYDKLALGIARSMHTDRAVLSVLRAAAQEIDRLRNPGGHTEP